jgi:hypothetical protein
MRGIADRDASSACTMVGIAPAVVVASTRQRRSYIRNTLLPWGRESAPSAFYIVYYMDKSRHSCLNPIEIPIRYN